MGKLLRVIKNFSGGLSEIANDNMRDNQLVEARNTVPGENGLAWKIMSLGKDGKEGGAGYDSDITSS